MRGCVDFATCVRLVYVSTDNQGYRAMAYTSQQPKNVQDEPCSNAQPPPPQSVTPLPDEVIAEIDPALAYWLRSRL